MELKFDLNQQEFASVIAGEIFKVLKPLLLEVSHERKVLLSTEASTPKKEVSPSKSERKPRMLTVRDSAAYLGIAEKTLRNRLGHRSPNPFPVKAKHIGGKVLFDVKELDEYLNKLPTT